jgi:hypothetical protein
MQLAAELAITDSSANRHRALLTIEQYSIEMLQRDLVAGRVRDIVEGMSRSQRFQFVAVTYDFLDLLDGFWLVQAISLICVIAGPIGWILSHR